MPLPSPSSPQVSTVGAVARRRDGVVRARGCPGRRAAMTVTDAGSTPQPAMSRWRPASVMVTVDGRRGDHRASTSCWWGVGSASTVCRTVITGTRTRASTSRTSAPSATTEDPVLVLDQGDVAGVERRRRGPCLVRRSRSPAGARRAAAAGCRESTTRTTDTSAPASTRWVASADENVARPHCVGGKVDEDAEPGGHEGPSHWWCCSGVRYRPRAGPDRHPRASWPAGRCTAGPGTAWLGYQSRSAAARGTSDRPSRGGTPSGSPCSPRSPTARRPRSYGPWEQVASTLAEGLVERGHDVTLFATADSLTRARLHAEAPTGYEEDPTIDVKVCESLHIAAVFERAARVRRDLQPVRLPAAHLQPAHADARW